MNYPSPLLDQRALFLSFCRWIYYQWRFFCLWVQLFCLLKVVNKSSVRRLPSLYSSSVVNVSTLIKDHLLYFKTWVFNTPLMSILFSHYKSHICKYFPSAFRPSELFLMLCLYTYSLLLLIYFLTPFRLHVINSRMITQAKLGRTWRKRPWRMYGSATCICRVTWGNPWWRLMH